MDSRIRRSAWGFLLVALPCLFWVSTALAQRGTVVLRTTDDEASAEVRHRTEDELRSAGFAVVVSSGDGGAESLEEAEAEAAIAVVTIEQVREGENGGTEGAAPPSTYWSITVVDRVTEKTTERRVPQPSDAPPDAPRIAILAVELLYASLLEIETAPPVRGEVKPPPAVARDVRRRLTEPARAPRWTLRAGGGAAITPGGLPLLGGLSLGVSGWAPEGVGVDVAGFAVVTPVEVHGSDASARLSLATLNATLRGTLWPRKVLSLSGGLGGGLFFGQARGDALAPLEAERDITMVGLVTAAGAASWRVKRRLRLRLDVATSVAVPKLDVRFAGSSNATAGRPWVEATAGVEYVVR